VGDLRQLVTRLSGRNSRTTLSIGKIDGHSPDKEREINEEAEKRSDKEDGRMAASYVGQ